MIPGSTFGAVGGLALAALMLSGCESAAPPADENLAVICRPDAAETLAGRDRITDEQARRLTGASSVRQIQPGQPVTQDYRQERVTIETHPSTGKIVRAFCG